MEKGSDAPLFRMVRFGVIDYTNPLSNTPAGRNPRCKLKIEGQTASRNKK